ncbi:MAG: extracellular solute-binding protein [Hyphomicrobiales bacterium]
MLASTSIPLQGITWDHPRGYLGLQAASEHYAAEHGVDISWDRRSLQAFADEPIETLAAKYDFIVLDHPHVGMIAETGSLLPLPLPSDAATASLGGSLESYIWRDELLALPIDAACQVAVRRADLAFSELPNWEAVFDATPDTYKMVTPLLPVDAFDMMMTLVAGRGEEHLPQSPAHFTSDENGLLALSVLKALYKLGPSEAVKWNPIKALEALSTTNDFAYSPCLFGYINYARPGFRKYALSYCDLPSFEGSRVKRGILGGAGIGVSSKTAYPQQAMHFAQWVTSEPVQSGVYLENDGQPAHRATWHAKGDDPAYAGFLTGGRHTIENAWTRPRDVWFLGFVDDVCDIFPSFFLKDQDAETMLAAINTLYRHHRAKKD